MTTKDKILQEAKIEFINKGYHDASLRTIAKKCGISAAALYRHFENKEDIFQKVIEPFVIKFNEIASFVQKTDYELLNNNQVDEMWNFEMEGGFHFDILFNDQIDIVKLIVKERKDWFKDFIITFEYEATIKYINAMKEHGYKVKVFNDLSFKALLDSYLESYIYILNKNLNKEELFKICNDINVFYTLGFRDLFGF
ncbi:MAG: TetR/AcrR family transcriptional regulator [Acholeplasmatales bacterium]|nr:TetR/AcrR family transcriptional regulator [Acholeplasmatales bacterium]